MAISIPALLDAQLVALQASLRPNVDAATNTAASSHVPMLPVNRVADLINEFCGLVDSGTLTVEGIHKVADATNPVSAADATDLSSAQTLLNELKADYNAHRVLVGSNEHVGADVTNVVSSADATNQSSAETLANEIKVDLNAHRALAAATGHYIADPDNAVTSADASDLTTLITLSNELKADYNAHIATINGATTTTVNDRTAFTTVNSLVGCTITFAAATTTTALQGESATILSHTASVLTLVEALPATPVEGDTFTLSFSLADVAIEEMRQGKGLGSSASNPYGSGPAFADAILRVMERLGASRETLDSGVTDGAGSNTQLVDSGGGWTINDYVNLWAFADDAGTLDVDNLRRIVTNTATQINVTNAFWNAAGAATTPGASTNYAIRDKQLYTATAAAGAATTLTFPATISFAANELIGVLIVIVSGTGAGQRRLITANTAGVSSVVTVAAWDTNPDGTSVFELRENTMPLHLAENSSAMAEPFGIFSPHGGGSGAYGHSATRVVADALQVIRDLVAAYTAPA